MRIPRGLSSASQGYRSHEQRLVRNSAVIVGTPHSTHVSLVDLGVCVADVQGINIRMRSFFPCRRLVLTGNSISGSLPASVGDMRRLAYVHCGSLLWLCWFARHVFVVRNQETSVLRMQPQWFHPVVAGASFGTKVRTRVRAVVAMVGESNDCLQLPGSASQRSGGVHSTGALQLLATVVGEPSSAVRTCFALYPQCGLKYAWNMVVIRHLDLSSNGRISGVIPDSIGRCSQLGYGRIPKRRRVVQTTTRWPWWVQATNPAG